MTVKMEIIGLSFSYDSWSVLENITYQLPQSSFTGLIGPNGSGKSTLLKNITRFLHPSEGELLLEGEDIKTFHNKDLAKKIAVVPQNTSMSFDFSVRDIVLMGRTPHQRPFQGESLEDQKRVKEAMEETNTLSLAERSFLDLSGGEKQRVIIARALCQEPEILLLDEPTSHLDINYQLEIFELLRRLNLSKGLTIMVVSHDLNLASQYCSELILLKEGKIFALGPPEDVITRENLEEIYHTKVLITQDPSGRPHVFLKSFNQNRERRINHHIHIICGGGSGGELMENLSILGYKVSTGVLNKGDMDWKTAVYLGISTIEEEPFLPISRKRHEENLKVMEKAQTIILTDVPFGHGNLDNLKALERMGGEGKNLILFRNNPEKKRDYTGGEALEILERLKSTYPTIKTHKELLHHLFLERGEDERRWKD